MTTRILVVDDSPTIRRVVSAVLERNGYEALQATDGEDAFDALSRGRANVDLVLLDFVMPRMNGFQFCRKLRARPAFASMPVVLMSAKSDRIREQFVEQTGALDAIAKPFEPQALIAVVENALRRVQAGHVSESRLPVADGDDEDATVVAMAPAMPQGSEPELETQRTNVAHIVAQKLVELMDRVLTERPNATQAELVARLTERLSKEALLEMTEVLRELTASTKRTVLEGDLGVVPIGAVLQLLSAENQSGVLVCRGERKDGTLEVTTTFRGGLIDLVQSSGASDEFRLGRYFVEEGILTPAQIDVYSSRAIPAPSDAASSPTLVAGTSALLSSTAVDAPPATTRFGSGSPPVSTKAATDKPLGMRLLEAGKITSAQLAQALSRQSSELLYDVIRWERGRFELKRAGASAALASHARLGLPVASVVLEGFRRVDEWRVLERSLGSFDGVLLRDEGAVASLDHAKVLPREAVVLGLVDGTRSIRAIVAKSHLSSFDACRILVQLLEARVLRRRPA